MPTRQIPNRNFDPTPVIWGAPPDPAIDVPQKAMDEDGIVVQLTSNNWNANPGRRLRIIIEQSFDLGQTWRDWSFDSFLTGVVSAKDGSLPSIILRTDDGHGVFQPRRVQVTVSAPDGVVNAGAIVTF